MSKPQALSLLSILEGLAYPLQQYYKHITEYTAVKIDPLKTSPMVAGKLRIILVILLTYSTIASVTAPLVAILDLNTALYIITSSIILYVIAETLPIIWRSVEGSGVDSEIPALLLYLIPYMGNPKYLADVLEDVPEDVFKWTRHEASKLRMLSRLGLDPVSSLRKLQELTPSRRLRIVLSEYLNLQAIGATRASIALRITSRALDAIRDSWANYSQIGKLGVEATVTSLVAIGALLPLAGGDSALYVVVLPVVAVIVTGVALLLMRPRIGDSPRKWYIPLIALSGIALSVILITLGYKYTAIFPAAISSLIGELSYVKIKQSEEQALINLRVAGEKARYGQDYMGALEEAKAVGEGIVEAVIRASRIAGSIGLGEALSDLARILDEAYSIRRRVWIESILLEAISIIAPIIALVTLEKAVSFIGSTVALLGGVTGPSIDPSTLMILAPITPLAASIYRRGINFTATSSLIALVLVLLVV
ncbi:MAG: hypothetical protein GSR77_06215 [Desulfurococcales archaeon]|nr:hypothetical protein [Desulfurococcales archaeon]